MQDAYPHLYCANATRASAYAAANDERYDLEDLGARINTHGSMSDEDALRSLRVFVANGAVTADVLAQADERIAQLERSIAQRNAK